MITNRNIYDMALHYIGRNKATLDPMIIIIGAMDGVSFDDTRGYINMYQFPGLFVEPIKEQFERLVKSYDGRSDVKFENSAIHDTDGQIEMLRIDQSAIDAGLVHPCFGGMSAVTPPRNGLASDGDKEVVNKYGRLLTVNCITLEHLFRKHGITETPKTYMMSVDTEGHDWKVLKQINNRIIKTLPVVIRIEYINLSDIEKLEVQEFFNQNGYTYSISGQNIDAVNTSFLDNIPEAKVLPVVAPAAPAAPSPAAKVGENLTVVTGIWNIGRDNAGEGFKRPFEHYIDNFNKLLISLKDTNVLIYVESQYIDKITPSPNHRVYNREVDWFKKFDFYSEVQKIRSDEKWLSQAGWLKDSAQASLEMYNPLVMSKYFLLNDATIFNPFNTDYFVWVDGGITNTVHPGYFSHDKVLDKITKYIDPFLFVSFPYATGPEIHGFSRPKMNELCNTENVEYVCRGGIFGGHKTTIREYNSYYHSILRATLTTGYMGTEESIFTIMSHQKPNIFKRSMIMGNGLVNKFFENLKNDAISLLPERIQPAVKQVHDNKVSIYTLTFNSPNQFERSCISWSSQKRRFDLCRKILIDNSTDASTGDRYQELCLVYNFEYIKTDRNLGICGGRQFVAEHFDASDSDFYIFLEDDMFLNPENSGLCPNGFRTYVPDIIQNSLKIMLKEQYDFLKFSFTEFFGDNSTQWAWYNVPQAVRAATFPEHNRLPERGLDPNAPRTVFTNIKSLEHIPYADGEVYYCNWPQMVSKEGSKKMFLETKWARPYEQTWMSYIFQETTKDKIRGAVLLATPVTHNRFDHYNGKLRVES